MLPFSVHFDSPCSPPLTILPSNWEWSPLLKKTLGMKSLFKKHWEIYFQKILGRCSQQSSCQHPQQPRNPYSNSPWQSFFAPGSEVDGYQVMWWFCLDKDLVKEEHRIRMLDSTFGIGSEALDGNISDVQMSQPIYQHLMVVNYMWKASVQQ